MDTKESLLSVVDQALKLVLRPANDFSWSSWLSAEHASFELNHIRQAILSGDFSCLAALRVIFAPTGPMQELSLSSGWGDEFLSLAAQLDEIDQALSGMHGW